MRVVRGFFVRPVDFGGGPVVSISAERKQEKEVKEGEKVVVEGLLKVRAGAPVKPVPWQPKNAPAAAAPSTAAK